jgi:hypothetical protein
MAQRIIVNLAVFSPLFQLEMESIIILFPQAFSYGALARRPLPYYRYTVLPASSPIVYIDLNLTYLLPVLTSPLTLITCSLVGCGPKTTIVVLKVHTFQLGWQ